MENFIDTFREEASGLLDEMEEALLKLDKKKDDIVIINEVFRVMHTLKGTSSMFGFDSIGNLTHYLENIYDLARENNFQITETIINLTLKITDLIKKILANPEEKENDNTIEEYIKQLKKISDNDEIVTNEVITHNTNNQNLKTYYIVFKPTEQLLYRGINILSIFKELSEIGNYKIIHHKFKDGEEERVENSNAWGIYVVTEKTLEEIEDVFIFVIDNCNIVKVSDFNIFANNEVEKEIEILEKQTASQSQSLVELIKDLNENPDIPARKNEQDIEETIESSNEDIENTKINQSQSSFDNKRISVNSDKLDKLMNLVSDLVTSNAMLSMAVKSKNFALLDNIAEKFERLTRQFRDNALSVRLVSVRELLLRFKRLVRDLSKDLGKEVQFIIEGEETEMDKNIIDNLSDPLIHLFRNAIDHGIESPEKRIQKNKNKTGTIKLSAFYSGTYVYITIQDDGAGINPEKVKQKAISKGLIEKDTPLTNKEAYKLLFKPGFSTATEITGVSGRGVGLDVVKNKITEMQGEIEVDSEIDLGTTFTIKLQQTISIIDTLLIKSGDSLYLIPQSNIEFCIQENYQTLFNELNKRVVFEDQVLPFINLREIFKNKETPPEKAKLIIVNKNNSRYAIVADSIIGEHQAVIKPLGSVLKKQEYFTGVSLLGDGSLAFMIDLANMQEFTTSKSYAKTG